MLPESIPHDHISYLPHLIGLGFSIRKRLKVQDFDHPFHAENVMIASNALAESEPQQELSKWLECNVVVGAPGEDLIEQLFAAGQGGTIVFPELARRLTHLKVGQDMTE